jgi:hypothetical protein
VSLCGTDAHGQTSGCELVHEGVGIVEKVDREEKAGIDSSQSPTYYGA